MKETENEVTQPQGDPPSEPSPTPPRRPKPTRLKAPPKVRPLGIDLDPEKIQRTGL